jgi:hypothetical protein
MQMSRKILLILSRGIDKTTYKVIKYLKQDIDFVRINDDDNVEFLFDELTGFKIITNSKKTVENKDLIENIWYRTGVIYPHFKHHIPEIEEINKLENAFFKDYLVFFLENNFNMLGSASAEFTLNKLTVLSKAKKNGLKIPFSIATNCKNIEIKEPRQIVKPVSNIFPFEYKNYIYAPKYTIIEDGKYASNSISFCQDYIDKEFEVRSFYLYGKFFSMAIFSQKNPMTRTDFRNYDQKKPNRNVPFNLPEEVEEKLRSLMEDLGLNTGSIDLIYSTKK